MKKMLIIGAGVSGLAAGCYAAMNGFRVEILEKNPSPGGVCTSWRRNGFLFDHCLHWVLGSSKGNSMYPLFEELGISDGVSFYHKERFRRIQAGGRDITLYTDINKLEKELIGHFPGEKKRIENMMRLVRFYTGFRPPMDADFGRFSLRDVLKMLPYMPSFFWLKSITAGRYLKRFRDTALKEVLLRMFPVPELPALMVIMPLAYFHNREGGYPLGGSLHFAKVIEERFLELGGTIRYNCKAEKIMVEKNRAAGIIAQDGGQYAADIVVSACDAKTVLYDMLGEKYIPQQWKKLFHAPSLWPPLVCVSLGVDRDLSGEVELNSFKLNTPVRVGPQELNWINYCHYCQDSAFAPKGKSVITLQYEADYDYWKALYADKAAYAQEKSNVLQTLLQALETHLPGISQQVEAADVATPVTWERYTGNFRGSYEGWLPTVRLFGHYLPVKARGLEGFYITGQWTSPGGGVPMCISRARMLIKSICRECGIPFTAGR